eukprot:GHVU01158857.1.p1 GENE.GHVU01158857.1~~GHVU01158857.1.p1  ORF type:complete len:252 (+),score=30.58 GHVU01158857.1:2-757(+)
MNIHPNDPIQLSRRVRYLRSRHPTLAMLAQRGLLIYVRYGIAFMSAGITSTALDRVLRKLGKDVESNQQGQLGLDPGAANRVIDYINQKSRETANFAQRSWWEAANGPDGGDGFSGFSNFTFTSPRFDEPTPSPPPVASTSPQETNRTTTTTTAATAAGAAGDAAASPSSAITPRYPLRLTTYAEVMLSSEMSDVMSKDQDGFSHSAGITWYRGYGYIQGKVFGKATVAAARWVRRKQTGKMGRRRRLPRE